MSLKHYTEILNIHFWGWGYSSTGSVEDSCVLGDGIQKVVIIEIKQVQTWPDVHLYIGYYWN